MRAVESGLGIAVLPDYLGAVNNKLVRVAPEAEGPSYDTYFVYAEEMRNSKAYQRLSRLPNQQSE